MDDNTNAMIVIDPAYKACLPFSLCLQVLLIALAYVINIGVFLFALIPAAAYWIITPVVILRHSQPTRLDLQMVRSGYAFYLLFATLVWVALGLIGKLA